MRRFFKTYAFALLMLPFLLPLTGCTDDVSGMYSTERAYFHCPAVMTTTPLYQALTNPGIYCKITFDANYYYYENTAGQSLSSPRTQLSVYGSPQYIAGFIVGTPSVPDLSGNFYQVAYDLVCPTCYDQDAIQRSLTLSTTEETATCSRCKRVYSLYNNGIITEGDAGSHLKRYRCTYAAVSNTFTIANY